jgi:hypothetical protein
MSPKLQFPKTKNRIVFMSPVNKNKYADTTMAFNLISTTPAGIFFLQNIQKHISASISQALIALNSN